jgi:hypothetical protein
LHSKVYKKQLMISFCNPQPKNKRLHFFVIVLYLNDQKSSFRCFLKRFHNDLLLGLGITLPAMKIHPQTPTPLTLVQPLLLTAATTTMALHASVPTPPLLLPRLALMAALKELLAFALPATIIVAIVPVALQHPTIEL